MFFTKIVIPVVNFLMPIFVAYFLYSELGVINSYILYIVIGIVSVPAAWIYSKNKNRYLKNILTIYLHSIFFFLAIVMLSGY